MGHTDATDVLVAGAGPVGLTAATELRRQGVRCRIVDRLAARLPYAKAVGIQPRTLELWDRMGLVRAALEAAAPIRGQLTYLDGAEQPRIDLVLPPEVPYGFAALPQYDTERILEEALARYGTGIERGTELVSFDQDADGVTCRLAGAAGQQEVRCRYLVGCDGAHSTVRKGLGLAFEGAALPEEYMLADVEVGWQLPPGYGVRCLHHGPDGAVDDLLVCIPLPGPGRYRMSMLVPPDLSTAHQNQNPDRDRDRDRGGEGATAGGRDAVEHGLQGGPAPELHHIQAVLDRLSPQPTTASAMRWSSVFRISHRLADRYSRGRVFVAGDAAHIHPPTGAQGMNTGIQDAYNLAWKLALTLDGTAQPQLAASYDAERRPIGQEVVGRTVRHAAHGGVQTDPADPQTLILREAQLLLSYRGSPIVDPDSDGPDGGGPDGDSPDGGAAGADADAPRPGDRAPDCTGLTQDITAHPLRLYDLLRDRGHVLLLYGTDPAESTALAAAARKASGDRVETCALLARDTTTDTTTTAAADSSAAETSAAAGSAADGSAANGSTTAGSTTGGSAAPGSAADSSPAASAAAVEGGWLPVYRDARGEFARIYRARPGTAFVVRPDGYLGARLYLPDTGHLAAHFARIFRPPTPDKHP
ncbi:pentachlorophenol monooxygenase [Streptacidiphilus sp. PB12-B1b]|uniref:FAD-dependent monooxygenase n=1 Tax=Streptacidiphilus sp. PB12-B1b TaxID=2705012 RepID=UPI0015F8268E|nr:FAD-dependent monooxygenase [Streptacidiphilus sp. PB12-B1b]QMU77264.1 pentachlorophenol monooxygenase [Streptacidiphilus sp. PB12-B1b]